MGLSLPRTSPEPPLCRLMTPLLPPPGAAFPEVLRLLQPAALLPDWVVRCGGSGDVAGVAALVAGLVGGEDLVEAFVEAAGEAGCVCLPVCKIVPGCGWGWLVGAQLWEEVQGEGGAR